MLFFPLDKSESPHCLCQKVGVARIPFTTETINKHERLQSIHTCVVQLLKEYPELEIICMPESTIPWDLNDVQKSIFCQAIAQRIILVCGGHQKESEQLFNVAWIFNGDSCYACKKCHLFKGIESPVRGITYFMKNNVFFHTPVLHEHGQLNDYKVLICSELLFDVCLYDCKVIALINDAWFKETIISQLLFLLAILQSMRNKLMVLYISYEYGLLIEGTTGSIFLLSTSSHKTDLGVYS